MKYGCIGESLGHSVSPSIHEKIGTFPYKLCPMTRGELEGFFARREFEGINVTIPYKKEVIPFLDEISPRARQCGSVNTVVHREGKLFGYNTDYEGLRALIRRAGLSLKGKRVLILGTGGAAGAAVGLCRDEGALVQSVSRTGKNHALTYEKAKQEKDTQILINATPCGMFPHWEESPISLSFFPRLEAVVDAVYNPLRSRLILEAEEKGIPAVGGLSMLVAQAVEAAVLFTGREEYRERSEAVFRAVEREMKNVVLIGMPGCGKSTLGRALAERKNVRFLDLDEEIVREAGTSIPEIFAREGEAGFRFRESRLIREIAPEQGLVIATGGGAILRKENVAALKANGLLIFLDAPLCDLQPTDDRPLASARVALERCYEERYRLYCAAADRVIPVTRSVEKNIRAIEKELE